MSQNRKSSIDVQGSAITVLSHKEEDLICLTDIARVKNADRSDDLVRNWLRNRNTVEFLGIWERLNNPDFNSGEFATIKSQVGLSSYKLSVKDWVEKTSAIGLRATAGRYGGTYAHADIAFEFGMWISPEFKLYLVKEFRRLKEDVLNIAMFGQTAKAWRDDASIEQLLVLANLESLNAEFIHIGLAQGERLQKLNEIAIRQLRSLTNH